MIPRFKHWILKTTLCIICLTTITFSKADTIPEKNYRIQGLSNPIKKLIEERLQTISFPLEASSQMKIAECKSAIQQVLEAFGYFQSDIQAIAQPDHCTVYTITKGPQLLITALFINITGDGALNPTLKKVVKKLQNYKKRPMTTENYQHIKEILYQSAISEGYLDAFFETHQVAIHLEHYTASATLTLNTNPQYKIHTIRFLRNLSIFDIHFLKKFLGIKKGDPYQLKNLLASENLLRESGYFEDVLIETPVKSQYYQVPVHITLQPARKYHTLLNLNLRSDLGIRIKAEGTIRYLNPKGHQLGAMLETSREDLQATGFYTIPGNRPARQKHHIQFEHKSNDTPSPTKQSDTLSVRPFFRWPFKNPATILRHLYSQQFSFATFSYFTEGHYEHFHSPIDRLPRAYIGLTPGFSIEKKKAIWSNKALYYTLNFQIKGTPLASCPFLKLEAKSTFSTPLPFLSSSYLIVRAKGGNILTKNLHEMPSTLRFYAGGDHFPRGYPTYLLGDTLFTSSIEARFHITGLFYMNPFFDYTYDHMHKQSTQKSTSGIGVCLWYSHIGSIEIDGIYRHHPDTNQSHWGLIAKISTDLI